MFNENSLTIGIEKNIKNTFLIIKNIKINMQSYEFKILNEEDIDCLIKQQIEYEDEREVLKYNINNLISLDEYLKNNKLNKKDIKFIIRSIDNMLNNIENYLLSENSILLDTRCIMIFKEKDKVKIKFMAIANYNSDFSFELSKLLINLLRRVDANDKDTLALAYQLFVKSSKDNFTINDLLSLCDKDDERENSNFDINENDENFFYYENIDYADEINATYNENNDFVKKTDNYEYEKNENDENIDISKENEIEIDSNLKDILNDNIFDKSNYMNMSQKDIKKKDNNKKLFDFNFDTKILSLKKFIKLFLFFTVPILIYIFMRRQNIYQKLQTIIVYEMLIISLFILNKLIDKIYMKIK